MSVPCVDVRARSYELSNYFWLVRRCGNVQCGIACEDLLTTATAALLNFALFLNRNIRKNETIQAIETLPRSRIHKGPSCLSSFAVWSTGLHISKMMVPSAKQLTTTNSRIFLKNTSPPLKDRRRNHNNTNPTNHSIGVFRNQGRGGCTTASPGFASVPASAFSQFQIEYEQIASW